MSNGVQFKDLFGFEKMIAPTIIKVVYIIGLILITLGVIATILEQTRYLSGGEATGFLIGAIITYGLIILVWRIVIELYFVMFGIHERLGEIRDRLGGRQP